MRLWIIVSIAVVICAVCIDAGKTTDSDSAEKKEDDVKSGSASKSATDDGDGGNKQNEDDAKAAPSPVVDDGKKGDENEAETCTAPKSQEYEVNIKVSGKIGHLVKVLKAIEKAEQPSNNCGQNKQKSGKQGSDEENKKGDEDDEVAFKSQSEDSGKPSVSAPSNGSGEGKKVESLASETDEKSASDDGLKRRRRR